jgi:hypothetical protein
VGADAAIAEGLGCTEQNKTICELIFGEEVLFFVLHRAGFLFARLT